MAFIVGLAGEPNTGKSYSRKFIPDGENVFVIAPSPKALWLKDSQGQVVKKLNVSSKAFKNFQEARPALGLNPKCREATVLKTLLKMAENGSISAEAVVKARYMTGNFVTVTELEDVDIVLEFITTFMPWIHTVIVPDFSHYISYQIAQQTFIERKNGGEAYQRFWELAADAMRNFLLNSAKYSDNLIIVTEYHAEPNLQKNGAIELFIPAGKMLTEKFKVESYYDFLFFTDANIVTDPVTGVVLSKDFRFVTEPTQKYPQARAMDSFGSTFIPNNLYHALAKVREVTGMELPAKWEAYPNPQVAQVA